MVTPILLATAATILTLVAIGWATRGDRADE